MRVKKGFMGDGTKIHVDEIAITPNLLLGNAVIVESGTVGSDYYIKYGDGTLFQVKSTLYNGSVGDPWGNVYCSPLVQLGDWPIPFTISPYGAITIRSSTSAWASSGPGWSDKSAGGVYIVKPTATSTATSYYVHVWGIGRWK